MKKIKCKVCGSKFAADKETLYLASERTTLLTALTSISKTFECFDCPSCGCQNTVGIRIPAIVDCPDEDTDEEDFDE